MNNKLLTGWQEWCALPDLHIPAIKAKVDTGARTSSIHAFNIKPYSKGKKKFVRFDIHPLQHNDKLQVKCHAPVVDERDVISSNGHREHRYVIQTELVLGEYAWDIEVTLSNRDPMKFRMLLGREALSHHVVVDPARKLCQDTLGGAQPSKLYRKKS